MSPEHYIEKTVADALGRFERSGDGETGSSALGAGISNGLRHALLHALTGGDDLDTHHPHPSRALHLPQAMPDLHDDLAALERMPDEADRPNLMCARWPGGRQFALLLSHDIDQIHDRELWRVLADVNHIRRVWQQGEHGSVGLAFRRLTRALFSPKPAALDYDTILEIEKRHGFRSTFFVLHDRYWARQGARFSIEDPEIQTIARRAKEAGCEVTVHGGYYRFNDAERYRQSREEVGRVFSVQPEGIRNHLLRYSYPDTWRAHAAAGFSYDATYGYNCRPGPRSGLALPFYAYDRTREEQLDLVVLPLTVMDTNIYRFLRLQGEQALEAAWAVVKRLADRGALVTLLWHGNFFNEPEYWDWQYVYERLLERLEQMHPWCATAAEINDWWRARCAVRLSPLVAGARGWETQVEAGADIEDLLLVVRRASRIGSIVVEGLESTIERSEDVVRLRIPRLRSGQSAAISLQAP